MTVDEYRRRGFEAQRQAAGATNRLAKADFEQLAQEWFALADCADWLERRYGPVLLPDRGQTASPVVQQQQQIQPKSKK
jgi:hypothetical protein